MKTWSTGFGTRPFPVFMNIIQKALGFEPTESVLRKAAGRLWRPVAALQTHPVAGLHIPAHFRVDEDLQLAWSSETSPYKRSQTTESHNPLNQLSRKQQLMKSALLC